ncbi:MAG: ParB/RepB/Spo0J family partition protein, partial [Pseudomonadota bacterium]
HSYTQEQVAAAVGKSRSHVANLMRLVGLPDSVQALLRKGELSMGHARALLKARRPEALAEKIVAGGLSVRAAEKLAQDDKADAPEKAVRRAGPRAAPKVEKDADTRALEEDLARALGLAVSVEHEGEGGQVVIRYGALEQLDEICRRLCQA